MFYSLCNWPILNRLRPPPAPPATVGWLLVVAAALSSGCARTDTAPARVASAGEPSVLPEAVDRGPVSAESEIGGLSQFDVERQFMALQPRVVDCVRRASSRLDVIGGRVNVRMRLDRAGYVRWAYLSDSTLGDRGAELCVLDLVKAKRWPKPLSGEGLAEAAFEVDPAEAPGSLPAYRGAHLARRAAAATKQCRSGIRGAFQATAYVAADGEVLAAGVAPPDENGEAASDCIAGALRDLRTRRLAAQEGAAAKVSFRIAN